MDQKTTEYFLKQLDFANRHFYFKDCQYYPCHYHKKESNQNCLFCYCPFYPCKNRIGSGKWVKTKEGKKTWDCSGCTFIHQDEIVSKVYSLLYEKKSLKQIIKILRNELKRGKK